MRNRKDDKFNALIYILFVLIVGALLLGGEHLLKKAVPNWFETTKSSEYYEGYNEGYDDGCLDAEEDVE